MMWSLAQVWRLPLERGDRGGEKKGQASRDGRTQKTQEGGQILFFFTSSKVTVQILKALDVGNERRVMIMFKTDRGWRQLRIISPGMHSDTLLTQLRGVKLKSGDLSASERAAGSICCFLGRVVTAALVVGGPVAQPGGWAGRRLGKRMAECVCVCVCPQSTVVTVTIQKNHSGAGGKRWLGSYDFKVATMKCYSKPRKQCFKLICKYIVGLRQNWIVSQISHFCCFIKHNTLITHRLSIFPNLLDLFHLYTWKWEERKRRSWRIIGWTWCKCTNVSFFLYGFLAFFFLTHWASRQHLWCLTKLLPTCLFHLRKASVESLFFTCKKNKMPPSSDINCCSVGCCCFSGNSHDSGASRSFKGQFAVAAAAAAATCVLYTHRWLLHKFQILDLKSGTDWLHC